MMPVTMIPVKSSNIAKIGYDALALQLNVEFKNGKTFGYKYVSLRDFDKLICANSVGKHFNALIKPDKVAFEIFASDIGDTFHVSEKEAMMKSVADENFKNMKMAVQECGIKDKIIAEQANRIAELEKQLAK